MGLLIIIGVICLIICACSSEGSSTQAASGGIAAVIFTIVKLMFIGGCLFAGPPGWITLVVVALLMKD